MLSKKHCCVQTIRNIHSITLLKKCVMLTLLPGNYKSLICPKKWGHIWWLYYLNDSL